MTNYRSDKSQYSRLERGDAISFGGIGAFSTCIVAGFTEDGKHCRLYRPFAYVSEVTGSLLQGYETIDYVSVDMLNSMQAFHRQFIH